MGLVGFVSSRFCSKTISILTGTANLSAIVWPRRKDGVLDGSMFQKRIEALADFGIVGDSVAELFQTLGAIVHLGALAFETVEQTQQDSSCSSACSVEMPGLAPATVTVTMYIVTV